MTGQELGDRIVSLSDMLYHIGCGLLDNEADRRDAVQNAVLKAWRKARSLKEPSKLKPWLARVMINECYNILRKKKREVPFAEPPETVYYPDDDTAALREALDTLDQSLRMPLVLHYMEGFSISDIAVALRIPMGTVLSRMDRGRKQLKTILKEDMQ